MTFRRLLALLAVLGLIAAGCGGDRGEDESGGVSDPATDTTEAGRPRPRPATSVT